MFRSKITEDPTITLSRFKLGLRPEFQSELLCDHIIDLKEAYRQIHELERYFKVQAPHPFDSRGSDIRPGVPSSKPQFGGQFQCGSSSNRRPSPQHVKGKDIANEPPKAPTFGECFRYRGRGHIGAQCPIMRNSLYIEDAMKDSPESHDEKNEEDPEDSLGYGTPSEDDEVEGEDGYLTYVSEVNDYSSSEDVPLWVVRCALTQPKQEDDWHRTNIFYT